MSRRNRARRAGVDKADGNRLPAVRASGGVTFTPEQALALAQVSRTGQISTIAKPLPQQPVGAIPFGPGVPLTIAPINAPRQDSGRPEPRQYDYPVSWNLPGFADRLIPWAVLRSAADQIPLFRQCIEIRKNEIATLDFDIRISKRAVQRAMRDSGGTQRDTQAEMMKRLGPEIGRLLDFWDDPDRRNGLDFAAWANKALEEHFVLDALVIYPRLDRAGKPYSLEILDGSTIKPLLDEYGHRPLPPGPAFQQILQGFPRGEFIADTIVDEGSGELVVPGAYPSDRLAYLIHNVRTTTPYGYGSVEQALVDGDLWLRRHNWIRSEYTDGVMPAGWLEAGPGQADWAPEQLKIYGAALNDYLAGDARARQRFQILPFGMKPSNQQQANERYKPEFDLFLLKLVARHFDTTMAELGFTEQGGLGSAGWHEGQADVQDRAGTGPTLRRLGKWCTRLGRRFLDAPPELEFVIGDQDEDDEATEDTMWRERTQGAGATINEWRDEMGLPRFEFDEADQPFIMGTGGITFLEGALAKQEAQQAAADALTAAKAAGALPGALDATGQPGAAPGPGDGSQADGGQAKPVGDTTGKADAPDQAKADEIRAYRKWRRRNPGTDRPFEFVHNTAADLAGLDLDPAVDPVIVKAGGGDIPKAPAPTAGPASWPGWEVDLALAQLYAETLSQGLTGAVPDEFVREFLDAHTAQADRDAVRAWIDAHRVAGDVLEVVRSALADLYTEGYLVGDRSAVSTLTGAPVDWGDWSAGRVDAARKLISADGRHVGLIDLLSQADVPIKSIAANRLDELAGVLADGLDENQSPDEIARAVRALVDDPERARMITLTELNRAATAATLDRYDQAGVASTTWATAPDERVCAICLGNKAAGQVAMGERYPSGDYGPPGHPWCRCVAMPGLDEELFRVDWFSKMEIPDWVWAWDSSLHPRGPDGRFLPTMSGLRRLKERHVRAKAAGRDLTKLNEEIGRRLQYWQAAGTTVGKPKPTLPTDKGGQVTRAAAAERMFGTGSKQHLRAQEMDAKTPKKPKVKDLLKEAGEQVMAGGHGKEHPAEQEFMDLVRNSMEMHDPGSGLSVKVERGSVSGSGKARIEFKIYDGDGKLQGSSTRDWKTDDQGNLVVNHGWLKLKKDVQGSGFAARWNAHNEVFYREHGVDRIELQANLDVGGYAWAKQGYTWDGFNSMQNIKERIDEKIERSDRETQWLAASPDPARTLKIRAGLGVPAPFTPKQRAILDALRQQMTRARFDAGTAPTPLAIAMAGYLQGKNQVDENGRESWPGKQIMLGMSWDGMKKL